MWGGVDKIGPDSGLKMMPESGFKMGPGFGSRVGSCAPDYRVGLGFGILAASAA